ncbi:MAG: 3-methyladenine DNA glycosylase/8-oxoguanine DNA glycosylase [halophilic archaeon J07HX64]|nr:MAG: 3-methyladenine DNA glycosylase/8-oxoguanine DNA glycosylase [halophilic archaeon J07HX64]
MKRGEIPLDGPFDLRLTLESGQSYLWWREDGASYGSTDADTRYLTTTRAGDDPAPAPIRVHRDGDTVVWESTFDAGDVVRRRLGLDDDLGTVRASTPDDDLVEEAFDAHWGLRIVRDPPFGGLVSFICSAQMRVARIHGMQQRLRETFGTPVELDGETYHAYPTPDQLAAASEQELRDLSLGYRAPYVRDTAEMVANGSRPGEVRDEPYEEARETLTRYVGVGQKVADCVLLFSLEYLQAIPLDTWMRQMIEEYYPDCDRGSYADTSRALRDRLGGEYAGYAQTYIFYHLRTQ